MPRTEPRNAASISVGRGRRRAALVGIVLGALAIASVAYTGVSEVLDTDDGGSPATTPDITFIEGSDRLPSTTAQDWVTYADHVVVVTPTAQSDLGPDKGEIELGEGSVLRSIQMRVDEVVWSSPTPGAPAPKSFTWTGFGWTFHDGVENRSEMVPAHQPRIEIGHSYIMALDWDPDPCSVDARAGQWRGLGSDSTLPYDEHTIGVGEYEGKERDLAAARDEAAQLEEVVDRAGADVPLGVSLVGAEADALREILTHQKPAQREQYGQRDCEK